MHLMGGILHHRCRGIRLVPCPGQESDPDPIDVIVNNCDLPPILTIYLIDGVCYSLDPSDPCITAPSGSIQLSGYTTGYYNCYYCVNADNPPAGCTCTAVEWNAMCAGGDYCHGLKPTYKINNYTQTFFDPAGCTQCSDRPAFDHWDGVLHCVGRCSWSSQPEGGNFQVNGKKGGALLRLVDGAWKLEVTCTNIGAGTEHDIWQGNRTIGATPEGVFSFELSECTTPLTLPTQLEIVEA